MTTVKTRNNITEGNIFFGLIKFAVPLMLSGILQIFYNMADSIIVGKFSGDFDALGAVGSTSSLTGLITNVMISMSVGASVLVAQLYGAKKEEDVNRAVHTAMGIALIGGLVVMGVGFIVVKPVLIAIGTYDIYIQKATLYIRIICLGIPAVAVYNFGSGILRAIGDSRTPLYILSVSGLLNVGLNLFLVLVCHMSVAGVAIATVASQYLSASVVVTVLTKRRGECYQLSPRKIRIDKGDLSRIMRIGLPSAIQTSIFAVSNIYITSAINTFPPHVIEANTIAGSIEGLTYTAMNSVAGAALTYMGQNYGAKKYSRMNKIFVFSAVQVVVIGLMLSHTEMLFGRQLAALYIDSTNPEMGLIVDTVMEIFSIVLMLYFICGIFEVNAAVLKAMGCSVRSMIASIVGVGVRVVWVTLVVSIPKLHTVKMLFAAYVLAWSITIAVTIVFSLGIWRRLGINQKARAERSALSE